MLHIWLMFRMNMTRSETSMCVRGSSRNLRTWLRSSCGLTSGWKTPEQVSVDLNSRGAQPTDQSTISGQDPPAGTSSGVGLDALHNDDDQPVRTLRDRVPDGQTVRRKMETVGTWQRVHFGKRVRKYRNWFFEQVKNRL